MASHGVIHVVASIHLKHQMEWKLLIGCGRISTTQKVVFGAYTGITELITSDEWPRKPGPDTDLFYCVQFCLRSL